MYNKILTKAVALVPLTALLINPVQTMAGSNHTYSPVNNVASAKKPKYEKEIKIFPDIKVVKSKGKWAIVKTNGKKITGFIYDDVKVEKLNDTYGTIAIAVKKNGKWGFVNELGKETVSPKFDEVKEIMTDGQEGVYKLDNFTIAFSNQTKKDKDIFIDITVMADWKTIRKPEDSPVIIGMNEVVKEIKFNL